MPSFLSKVFGRKKQDDKDPSRSPGRASDASLLEGKFEAVSPTVSPTAAHFVDTANGNGIGNGKDKETQIGFSLFKTKSSSSSTDSSQKRAELPHLSLNLPGPKDESNSRALGVVFEADPDAQILLADSVIGERRLNPLETLILVRACSQAITARGLETLGIMHPHWYSASPDIQRRLISLFIQSLAPNSPITTLSPTPTAAVSAFESEIKFTRSPHDVAAVLRWGLRHLQLEGSSFGQDEKWYKNFSEAERSSEYPPKAFSQKLVPQLPPAHLELLSATLEILSSLASHAEANSTSGSKLSKFFGLWLLTAQRADAADDWSAFYARWEQAGRILEHLFLARIRDEAVDHRMPTRLLELVRQYPYRSSTPSPDNDLLLRPRFSTRRYDALFVRIETQLSASNIKPKHHPLRLISEAFKAEVDSNAGEHADIWDKVKKAGTDGDEPSPGGYPGLSRIFADETIRFLSLIPADNSGKEPLSPSFNLFTPQRYPAGRRRSFSMSDKDKPVAVAAAATANGHASTTGHTKATTDAPQLQSDTEIAPLSTDWAEFSTSGFLESISVIPLAATLLDKDVEVTAPRKPSKKKISPRSSSRGRGRKSLDNPSPTIPPKPQEDVKLTSRSTTVSLLQLDEAFIDFWSDALLDPISSDWPAFIICKLKKTVPGLEVKEKRVEWLVIEQAFKKSETPQADPTPESTRRARASSPKPSFRSDISGTFSATRKRFSFFTTTSGRQSVEKTTTTKRNGGKSPQIGEMGEILAEEDEKADVPKLKIPLPKPRKSLDALRKSLDRKSHGNGVEASGLVAAAAAGAGASAPLIESTSEAAQELVAQPELRTAAASIPAPASEIPVAATITHPPEVAPVRPVPITEATPAPQDTPAPEPTLTIEPTLPTGETVPEPTFAPEHPVQDSDNIEDESLFAPSEDDRPNVPHSELLRESPPGLDSPSGVDPLPAIPIVEADPIAAAHQPSTVIPLPVEESGPKVVTPIFSRTSVNEEEAELPPAPESVVLAGETPGPQVALSTSEPAAIAHATAPEPGPSADIPLPDHSAASSSTNDAATPERTLESPGPSKTATPSPEVSSEPLNMQVDQINSSDDQMIRSGSNLPHNADQSIIESSNVEVKGGNSALEPEATEEISIVNDVPDSPKAVPQSSVLLFEETSDTTPTAAQPIQTPVDGAIPEQEPITEEEPHPRERESNGISHQTDENPALHVDEATL